MPAMWKVSYRLVSEDKTKSHIRARNIVAENIVAAINLTVSNVKGELGHGYDIVVLAAEVIAWEGAADG